METTKRPATGGPRQTSGEPGGIAVYRAAAEGLKTVSLELGGKSANIVFDDLSADQDGVDRHHGQERESLRDPLEKFLEKCETVSVRNCVKTKR